MALESNRVAELLLEVRGAHGHDRAPRRAEHELCRYVTAQTRRAARSVTRTHGGSTEDLAADAAFVVWQHVVFRFQPGLGRSLSSFIFEAVRRVAIDEHRRGRAARRGGGARRLSLDDADLASLWDAPELERDLLIRDAVRRALARESRTTAEIVERALQGESLRDVAVWLGRHPAQITRRLRRFVEGLESG
jgi:DNA-directed RNA polymerase specialized sigma24 family protein